MSNKEINEKDKELTDVSNSFKTICNQLEKQITLVELRQQELQKYMSIIDGHIVHFDNAANHEAQQNKPDYAKLNKLKAASAKNIEIITDLHNSYKEYEGVKFRYFKEISDNNYKKNRLISVDIKRLGTSEEMGTEFYEIMRLLSKLNLKKGDNLNLAASQQVDENNKLLGLVEDGLDEDEYEL